MTEDHLRRQGANARAFGQSEFDNPFYRPENMPAATGEAVSDWNAKAQAWRDGWLAEDLIRSNQPMQ